MDYNKWGIVTGIIGLVLLGLFPIVLMLSAGGMGWYFFNRIILILSPFLSISFGIAAFVLGIISIKRGKREITALILGSICVIFDTLFLYGFYDLIFK